MDAEELQRLIARGEGQRLEFKESFAAGDEAVESLCAFANSQGGTVLFGVRDDKTVIGVGLGPRTLPGFANKLRQSTQPPLGPTLEEVELAAAAVVAVEVAGHQPGQLFTAFGRAFIRVGSSNHVMTPDEMRARLVEAQADWREEQDRPRFEVRIAGASRREAEYAPNFKVRQVSGEQVRSLEWRLRGPRFPMEWRVVQTSALERTHFTVQFDLAAPPRDDDRVGRDEMGFELRFHWRGKQRHELHRWPLSRREVNSGKVLWDAGDPISPPDEWDSSAEDQAGSLLELEALPPTHDNHLQLLLKNGGPAQEFVVDVIDFEGIEEPQQRYVMKWRGYEAEARTVYRGRDAVLDVAQAVPPEVDPDGIQNAIRRGAFRLFSTSLQGGWEVHAGQGGWVPITEAAEPSRPFDEVIALKVRVTGSLGANVTRRVAIGFHPPDAGREAVRIHVDDWPNA